MTTGYVKVIGRHIICVAMFKKEVYTYSYISWIFHTDIEIGPQPEFEIFSISFVQRFNFV